MATFLASVPPGPTLAAQSAALDAVAEERYVHERWTVEDGLPVNSVNAVLQSQDGYIWAATFDGLVRFDGVRFVVFNAANTDGLPSNRIMDLVEARDGSLWLHTEQKQLVRFFRGAFEHYGPDRGLTDTSTRTLHLAPDGTLWIGTDRDFGPVRDGRYAPVQSALGPMRVNTLAHAADGSLWIGTDEGRLIRHGASGPEVVRTIDGNAAIHFLGEAAPGHWWVGSANGAYRLEGGAVTPLTRDARLTGVEVRTVLPSATGASIWISSEAGVFRLDPDGRLELRSGTRQAIVDRQLMSPDTTGQIWYGYGTRLYREGNPVYDLASERVEEVTAPEEIRDFAHDHEGSIWLATHSSGLHRLKPALFDVYSEPEGVSYRNVYTVYEDRNGTIHVGTWGGGTSRILPDGRVLRGPDHLPRYVTTFAEDGADRLWIGSYGLGALLCASNDAGCRTPIRTLLPGARVLALYRDRAGEIWIGTYEGLAHFDGREARVVDPATGAPSTPVRVFAQTADGALWMGTNGGGLVRHEDGRFDVIGEDQGLPSSLVRALYEDEDGWLWVGTEGRGLARLDPTAWSSYLASPPGAAAPPSIDRIGLTDGLFDEVIHQILDDGEGRLWMSTNRGIFWVLRSQVLEFLDGRIDRIHSIGYTEREGMRNREANGGVQPAGIRASDGRLWFATQDGAVVVDPSELEIDKASPPVVIEAVVAGGRVLRPDSSFRLAPEQRDLQIDYTALSFFAPENVRFRYRLDGYNDTWVDAGSRRSAFYTGVPPGTYTFRVSASHDAAVWGEPVSTATFVVAPRFHETWTYYVVLSLTLALAAVAALRVRERRARNRETMLTRMVEDRTVQIRKHEAQLERQNAQLEAQAQRLEELDRAKSRFFANLSHEFRTPLTLTIGPLEDLRSGARGVVSPEIATDLDLALRNARRLLRLVNQILDVSRLEAGQLRPRIREDDLGELVRGVASSFAPLAERKGVAFTTDITTDDLCVFFDADLMEKVIANLLSNAFKFTPEGQAVRVSVATEGGEGEGGTVTVTVRDSGPGIRPEHLEHIFERFYRAPDTVAAGTGIGLSLAKELVELHGGRIDVESDPGFGTTFDVTLVRGSAHLPPEWLVEAPAASPDVDGDRASADGIADVSEVTPLSPDTADAMDRTTVLVVDDDPDVRSYLARHLGTAFTVIEAADGESALETAGEHLPDVIVSDVMMPGMSGSELCRRIKASPALSFIPVILLTAKATREGMLEGLEGGADEYMTKPFDPIELGARIRNLVRSRHRLWELARHEGRLQPSDPEARSTDERFLEQLRMTIEAHIDDETFDVESLALALGYSRSSLYRRLEGLVSESPAEIILGVRLERAAQLLGARAGTVSEIAYSVGFKSVSHFSRRFRGRYGVPPSEYHTTYSTSGHSAAPPPRRPEHEPT